MGLACVGLIGCSQQPPLPGPVSEDIQTPVVPGGVEDTKAVDNQDAPQDPTLQVTEQPVSGLRALLPFLFKAADPPAEVDAPVDIHCTEEDPHPIGQNIAETYAVPYEQVMTWFCSGFSFENILVALETSDAADIPADALLQMLLEKEWEEIWDEIGFANNT